MIETIYETSISTSSKFVEEQVSIKTVKNGRDNSALTNTIAEAEHGRVCTVPLDVGVLVHVDEHE